MKLTLELSGYTYTVENDSVTAHDIIRDVQYLLVGATFHTNSVKDAIIERAGELEDEL